MFNTAGKEFKTALVDNAKSYDFVSKLMKEKSPTVMQGKLGAFNNGEMNDLRAAVLSKHLADSIDSSSGKFDMTKFLKATSVEKNIDVVMGPSYKAFQGLQNIMTNANQGIQNAAENQGTKKALNFAAMAGLGAGVAYNPLITGGITASIAAATAISRYSPLKNMLIAASRVKNNSQVLNYFAKKIGAVLGSPYSLMQKAGLSVMQNQDGTLHISHEGDK